MQQGRMGGNVGCNEDAAGKWKIMNRIKVFYRNELWSFNESVLLLVTSNWDP